MDFLTSDGGTAGRRGRAGGKVGRGGGRLAELAVRVRTLTTVRGSTRVLGSLGVTVSRTVYVEYLMSLSAAPGRVGARKHGGTVEAGAQGSRFGS